MQTSDTSQRRFCRAHDEPPVAPAHPSRFEPWQPESFEQLAFDFDADEVVLD